MDSRSYELETSLAVHILYERILIGKDSIVGCRKTHKGIEIKLLPKDKLPGSIPYVRVITLGDNSSLYLQYHISKITIPNNDTSDHMVLLPRRK